MNGYPYLTSILILAAIGVTIIICCRRNLWPHFSSKPPPVIDADGEDVKERLVRAFEQHREASEELQGIIKEVLAENDRLKLRRMGRRSHAQGT